MSTSATATQAAAEAAVIELKKRLLPAVLKETNDNGAQIALYLNKNGLDFTNPDHLYKAVQAILFKGLLEWEPGKEPAALRARKQNEGFATIKSAQESQAEFNQKKKAGEAADAKKKADAETLKRIDSIIAAYTPVERGRIIFGRQNEVQTRLRAYVATQVARNADPQSISEQVEKEIQRLYAESEKAHERV